MAHTARLGFILLLLAFLSLAVPVPAPAKRKPTDPNPNKKAPDPPRVPGEAEPWSLGSAAAAPPTQASSSKVKPPAEGGNLAQWSQPPPAALAPPSFIGRGEGKIPSPAGVLTPWHASGKVETSSLGKITLAKSSYELAEQGTSPDIFVVVGRRMVAKRFNGPATAFSIEERHNRAVYGQRPVFDSGASQISNNGVTYQWIVSPNWSGRAFEDTTGKFKLLRDKKGAFNECITYLNDVVRLALRDKMIAMQKTSKLVILDTTRANTVWSDDGNILIGFKSLAKMADVNSPAYMKVVKRLTGQEGNLGLHELATLLGKEAYPDSMCSSGYP